MLRTGAPLTEDGVERSIQMLRSGEADVDGQRPAEVLTQNILSNRGRTIRPKTLNQKNYVDAIDRNTIVFGIGPAGSGKTYLAMAKAVQALQSQAGQPHHPDPPGGRGRGEARVPARDAVREDRPVSAAAVRRAARHDRSGQHSPVDGGRGHRGGSAGIYARPDANDAFIILDEAQNTSPEQMKMFLTRLGFGSKIVVTGDVTQVDLPGGTESGLRVVRNILAGVEDIHFAELTSADVVRHRLVGDIVDAYGRYDAQQGWQPADGPRKRKRH